MYYVRFKGYCSACYEENTHEFTYETRDERMSKFPDDEKEFACKCGNKGFRNRKYSEGSTESYITNKPLALRKDLKSINPFTSGPEALHRDQDLIKHAEKRLKGKR